MPKKIVFIANLGFSILNYRKDLIKEFIKEGMEVIVICPKKCPIINSNDIQSDINKIGASFIDFDFNSYSINPLKFIKSIYLLRNILKDLKVNYVICYNIKPIIFGSFAGRLSRVDNIYSNITGLGYIFTSNSLYSYFLRIIIIPLYFIVFKFNKTVFFQNFDDFNFLKKYFVLKNVKTKILNGSGINISYYKSNNVKKISNSFIFIGRILKEKGIYEYFNAAKKIKQKYPYANLYILGYFDNNPGAISRADFEKLNYEKNIEYIEPINDVRNVLDKMEVFVLPSYREGTPRSTLEAMSMGLPIITTNVPGCRETVVDEINGFLVNKNDYLLLSKKMEKFINDPSLVQSMGKKSKEIAISKFDNRKVNKVITSIILQA